MSGFVCENIQYAQWSLKGEPLYIINSTRKAPSGPVGDTTGGLGAEAGAENFLIAGGGGGGESTVLLSFAMVAA